MKKLKIEWKHLDVAGETCDRCYDTGENLESEIKRLKRALQPQGIEVEFSETKLDDTKIPESNTIFFNDRPIEEILDIKVANNYCASCTTLLGKQTYCRTVIFEGNEYEDIPAKAIRQAAYSILGLKEGDNKMSGNEKKGLFARLGNKDTKKNSCCCNFEIEEIPEDKSAKDGVKTDSGCCCAGTACCGAPAGKEEKKQIVIDYLFLDLSVCDRCQGAEDSLDAALNEVAKVLEATGTEVTVNKIHVDAREKAITHKFLCSPTIRINGQDIQLDYKESLCESCGDLCGDKVDCRVWLYQGKEYTVPPKAMIIEAILKAVYGGLSEDIEEKEYEIPDNLAYFYTVMEAKKNRS